MKPPKVQLRTSCPAEMNLTNQIQSRFYPHYNLLTLPAWEVTSLSQTPGIAIISRTQVYFISFMAISQVRTKYHFGILNGLSPVSSPLFYKWTSEESILNYVSCIIEYFLFKCPRESRKFFQIL